MITTGIARRYAEGLLRAAIKNNKVNIVEENLFDFINFIWVNKDIRKFLTHPKLPYDVKAQVLSKTIQREYDVLTMEFLKFLIKKDRINEIVPISYEFDALNDRYQGVLKVEVISAYPVSEEFLNTVKKELEENTGRKIKFNVVVDKNMILGIKIKIGDFVIENSLEYKLQNFLERITFRR